MLIRFVKRVFALTLIAMTTACGGGIALGLDLGYAGVYYEDTDSRPSVSLASSTSSARVGDVVRLVAAATDDYGVDTVSFFRVTSLGDTVPIATLRSPPYTIDVEIPNTSDGGIIFMARAVDNDGQYRDSELVLISIRP